MAMQTVFDAEGTAYRVEAVDAREYVKSGHYFSEPPARREVPPDSTPSQPAPDADETPITDPQPMTAKDLRAALDAKGIAYKTAASKAELQALLESA